MGKTKLLEVVLYGNWSVKRLYKRNTKGDSGSEETRWKQHCYRGGVVGTYVTDTHPRRVALSDTATRNEVIEGKVWRYSIKLLIGQNRNGRYSPWIPSILQGWTVSTPVYCIINSKKSLELSTARSRSGNWVCAVKLAESGSGIYTQTWA